MPSVTALHGDVAPGWGPVADAFLANFEPDRRARRNDVGAACCVYAGGRPVVDVWAGTADPDSGRPWARDTLQLVFSTTKGATALCAHLLAQRGLLDLDAPIASVWPEFAANGKERIPLRLVLAHRAGLAAIEGDLTLADVLAWDPVVAAIAAQAPNWEPGTAQGYHVRAYGFVVGEVVRRVTGRSLGRFFADEVAEPLGLDFWIGLPEAEEGRVARIVTPDADTLAAMAAFFPADTLAGRAMSGPSGLFAYDDLWNRRAVHAAELPSSNGIATARAVARMYAATVGAPADGPGAGTRLLDPSTVADATVVRSDETDLVTAFPMRIGTGFMLAPTIGPVGPARVRALGRRRLARLRRPRRRGRVRVRDEPARARRRPPRRTHRGGGLRGARMTSGIGPMRVGRVQATIFLPPHLAEIVDGARRVWDPASVHRIAPHVTVLHHAESAPALQARLEQIAPALAPFRLRIGRAQRWPEPNHGVYVTVDDLDHGLSRLRNLIVTAAGRPPRSGYIPHVTLAHARTVHRAEIDRAWAALRDFTVEETVTVDAASVITSTTTAWLTVATATLGRSAAPT